MNVDAAFIPDQNKGGIGGVLRDFTGQFVVAFARPIPCMGSPKQCELLAIREGFDMPYSLQAKDVIVESECMAAIQELQEGNYELLADGGLVDDIHQSWKNLQGVKLVYTPRTCNNVAHRLASLGFEADQGVVWFSQAPEDILDVLENDYKQLT